MADPKVFLGIVFELEGKEIALEPKNAITDIRTKGIECGLRPGETVAIGPVGTGLGRIFNTLGYDASSFLGADGNVRQDVLPDIAALKTAVNTLTQANLTVENFHLKLPGTETPDKTNYYTVGLSATWSEGQGTLIPSVGLKLKGIYFRVSNEG